MELSVQQPLEYKNIFDNDELSVEEILFDVGKMRLIDIAIFLLKISNPLHEFSDPRIFLEKFFCEQNNHFANNVYNNIQKIEREENCTISITNTLSSLMFFEYAIMSPKNDIDLHEAEIEMRVFKAYLLINRVVIEKHDILLEQVNSIDEREKMVSLLFGISLPISDFINYQLSRIFISQFVRSVFFFEYCEAYLPKHLENFLDYFDCSNWRDYLKIIISLIFPAIKMQNDVTGVIKVPSDDNFDRKNHLFSSLARQQVVFEDDENADFKILRNQPLYKVDEGIFRVIVDVFLVEKPYKSLYFKFSKINDTLERQYKIKNFRSEFCNSFSEKYLFYRVIKRSFGDKYIQMSGDDFKAKGLEGEPDYYVRNGNKIFLFESKDILINASIKGSYDFNKTINELRIKLVYDPKNDKKVGVCQLANSIIKILKKQLPDNKYKAENLIIYPILVLHERMYSVEGLNYFVNKWFFEELDNILKNTYPYNKIKPLVVIDIDTFVLYQDLLGNRTIQFEELLNQYYSFIRFDPDKKYKDEVHYEQAMYQQYRSFRHFSEAIFNKYKWVPKIVRECGGKLFE